MDSHARREGPPAPPTTAAGTGLLGPALALLGLTLILVLVRHGAPAPRSAAAPPTEFSAGRARAVLRELTLGDRPHPAGSAADAAIRQRIAGTLSRLGLQPHVEEGFACHPVGICARVRNVVAVVPGRESGAAVAAVAHYDSSEAGPGAADDLAGVAAVLEIARALRAGPPPLHPVVLLLDEGEEAGLIGASVFAASSPERSAVKAVVNLEARGGCGPSILFETAGDDAWMVSAWAARAPRPLTTSVAASIYAQLPNDTDLTVFRHRQVPGLNFAFIRCPALYHSADDDYAHCSPASLQHQGDSALAAVAGLANSPGLAAPPPGSMVFFDVLSLGVVRWPLGWTPWLAAAALLLVVAVVIACLARRTLALRDLARGVALAPAALAATALLAFGLGLALRLAGPLAVPWPAHPLPVLAAFWLLPLAVVAAVSHWIRRAAPLGLWAGVWTLWAVLGAALAALAPAASYVLVLPGLAAGICGALAAPWRRAGAPGSPPAAMVLVPALTGALLWFGVLPLLYDGLGTPALPVIAALLAVLLATLAPAFAASTACRGLARAAVALLLVAAVSALPLPLFSRSSPQALTFTFIQDGDTGAARWVADSPVELPAEVRRAVTFQPPAPVLAWDPAEWRARSAPAPPLPAAAAPAPEVRLLASSVAAGRRQLRLWLASRRGATIATLWVPAAAHPEGVRIAGQPVPETGWRGGPPGLPGWRFRSYNVLTLPAQGCEVDLEVAAAGPLELHAADTTHGLPPAGATLLQARPPTAAPQFQADDTLVIRKLTF